MLNCCPLFGSKWAQSSSINTGKTVQINVRFAGENMLHDFFLFYHLFDQETILSMQHAHRIAFGPPTVELICFLTESL